MAPAHSRPFSNLLNPQPLQSKGAEGTRNTSVAPSLKALNNHAEMSTPKNGSGPYKNVPRDSSHRLVHSIARSTSGESHTGSEGRRRAKGNPMATLVANKMTDRANSPPPSSYSSHKRNRTQSPNTSQSQPIQTTSFSSSVGKSQKNGTHGQSDHAAEPLLHRDLTPAERACLGDMLSIGLDDQHRQYAFDLAEVDGDRHRHLALCANAARGQYYLTKISEQVSAIAEQVEHNFETLDRHFTTKINHVAELIHDISGPIQNAGLSQPPVSTPQDAALNGTRRKWSASKELKAHLYALSVEIIPLPDLQSYTAVEDPAKNLIPRSLFNRVRVQVAKQNPAWKEEHLPVKIRGVNDGDAVRSYGSAIKTAGKHAREKLHLLLLTNIRNQKHGEVQVVAVPSIQALWYRIASKCGLIDETVDSAAAWRAADGSTRSRIAYLRREAARLRKSPGRQDIWKEVDAQLNKLREKDLINPHYSASFYNLIYEHDADIFDGKRSWDVIKRDYVLTLPSDEAILEGIPGPSHGGIDPRIEADNEAGTDAGGVEEFVGAGLYEDVEAGLYEGEMGDDEEMGESNCDEDEY
ncbi:hypothetical protein DFH28DRAFT_1078134 [Melampsora americana]|nr:hypothetical protein DFH28DRAFT_1078134 [Melampsora americana]